MPANRKISETLSDLFQPPICAISIWLRGNYSFYLPLTTDYFLDVSYLPAGRQDRRAEILSQPSMYEIIGMEFTMNNTA